MRITNRQLEIILFLNEVKKTTIQELADKFEVSKRTIMRDINLISSLGVPVHTQPGYQGGVSIPDSYKFQQSFFSPEEIEDLVIPFVYVLPLIFPECSFAVFCAVPVADIIVIVIARALRGKSISV